MHTSLLIYRNKFYKRHVLIACMAFSFLLYTAPVKAQKKPVTILIEAGATFFSNNLADEDTWLHDFLAFTFDTRLLLSAHENSSLSLDFPLAFRSQLRGDIVRRVGINTPLFFTYNYGLGASGLHTEKRIGFLIGAGWGYFYQRSKAKRNEIPQYEESLSATGPAVQAGLRFPMNRLTLFHLGERVVHPSLTIRAANQFGLTHHEENIASLSLLVGMAF
jgi:hypothetical protein